MISTAELDQLLCENEDQHLEFKRARNQFDLAKLINYSVALANEGGGRLVLGVADERPRKVVGCDSFRNLNEVLRTISDTLHLRAEVEKIQHPSGRVLIFRIPARPLGMPIQHRGAYWMRSGESLVPMTGDQLRARPESGKPTEHRRPACEASGLPACSHAAPQAGCLRAHSQDGCAPNFPDAL